MKTKWSRITAAAWLAWAAPLAAQTPGISLTSVPVMGSPADLSGVVSEVTPADFRVAVYLFVQGWWTKPTDAAPLTVIQNDGTWSCDITTGGADAYATKIAAFLVPQSYTPPLAHGLAVLPEELETNSVASVITERGSPNAFHWCGYDWDVKNSGGYLFGPGPNRFTDSTDNVWVDATGRLHLRITFRDGQWLCPEVVSSRAFGYGSYRFFLDSAVDDLDPNVVLGLFTYDHDPTTTGGHREIDVEFSRWGNAADSTNAQFVVQPYILSGNLTRWSVPATAPTTHSFTWSAGRVDYVSHNGTFAPPPASIPQIATWSNTSASVPTPGDERVRMNLWLFNGTSPSDGQEVEVVISRFAFIPLEPMAPRVRAVSLDVAGIFHLQLTGDPQLWYRLERSDDLKEWDLVSTTIAPEQDFELTDTSAASATRRFYRVAVVPGQ
ncbi:glycoside hydrolase family 16 protein [Haloferula sp. A504]|uniref:glycoside hydrolase family 16 protein n=1 Tax=Haloferula sp. A504 TaxID=3373601 RepID=UPI0031C3D6D8|nr:glycoside hydrolase family 16 protein [Verrucomicrobiaceae bacterium E54]